MMLMIRRLEKMDNLDISDEKFIESAKILGEYCKNSVVVTVN